MSQNKEGMSVMVDGGWQPEIVLLFAAYCKKGISAVVVCDGGAGAITFIH